MVALLLHLRPVLWPAVLLGLLVLPGGGAPPARAQGLDDGRPTVVPRDPACRGKPSLGLGVLDAAVVERPADDRAVVEATWTRRRLLGPARLLLVLPEGAWLVQGRDEEVLDAFAREGRARWTVGFETGRALDLVIRLAVRMPRDEASVETYVRLAAGD